MTTLMNYFTSPIAGEWGDEAEDCTDGVPVLRTTNFTADGRLSYDDLTFRAIDTEKKKDKILKPGDIIIEKSGGTPKKPVGRCVYFDRDDDYDYFCSNFTAVLRANPETVNTRYLWYILQEHYKNRQCLKYQYKTNGIANLDITDYLSHIEVDLPSRDVQDKRVEAMDYSQHLLDIHQELLDIMDKAVKSRFVEMFGDPMTNPKRWELVTLGDAVKVKPQNGLYKPQSDYVTNSLGTPILRIDAFYDGRVKNFAELKRLNCTNEEIQKYLLQEDDIVINRVNSLEYLGKCAHITGLLENTVYESNMMRFHMQDGYNPIYTTHLLCTPYMKEQIKGCAKQAVNQASINQQDVQSFTILKPPIDLQNQFADFVALTNKSKLTIQKSLKNLTELRESLMQEYFG